MVIDSEGNEAARKTRLPRPSASEKKTPS